jgi:hypothetical protein
LQAEKRQEEERQREERRRKEKEQEVQAAKRKVEEEARAVRSNDEQLPGRSHHSFSLMSDCRNPKRGNERLKS